MKSGNIAPRFLREYCAYKTREVKRVKYIPIDYREKIARNLSEIYNKCNRGFITPDEAIRLMSSPLSVLIDDCAVL